MKSVASCSIAVMAFVVVAFHLAYGQETGKIKSGPFEIQVLSATTSKSFPAYVGSGTVISAPVSGVGMPDVIMAKDESGTAHTYLRGKMDASPSGVLVKIKCEVKNVSGQKHSFQLVDLSASDKIGSTKWFGVGIGTHVFAKDEADHARVSKTVVHVSPNDKTIITYVFAIRDSGSLNLVWKGKQKLKIERIQQE